MLAKVKVDECERTKGRGGAEGCLRDRGGRAFGACCRAISIKCGRPESQPTFLPPGVSVLYPQMMRQEHRAPGGGGHDSNIPESLYHTPSELSYPPQQYCINLTVKIQLNMAVSLLEGAEGQRTFVKPCEVWQQ